MSLCLKASGGFLYTFLVMEIKQNSFLCQRHERFHGILMYLYEVRDFMIISLTV